MQSDLLALKVLHFLKHQVRLGEMSTSSLQNEFAVNIVIFNVLSFIFVQSS